MVNYVLITGMVLLIVRFNYWICGEFEKSMEFEMHDMIIGMVIMCYFIN